MTQRHNAADEKPPAAENRSFVRGLSVLLAVNEHNPATVSQVVNVTGLAKATVIRLLQTLRNQGYIDVDQESGGYKPLPKVRLLASSMMMANTFSIAIKRYLNEFAQRVKWPADFLIPEGSAMSLQTTNRNEAPIGLKRFEQTRFPILTSASGLAYLEALPRAERQKVIATVAANEEGHRAAAVARHTEQQVLATRERGHGAAYYNAPLDGMCAIAVPVFANERPIGSLALLILHEAVTPEQLSDNLLPKLHQAAAEVGKLYVQHGGTVPAVLFEHDSY
jgi:IclR family transcriptional regulator, mhp operon transcriptional activator